MGIINNPFCWSKSRAATFYACKRKYFFRYYQHWRGWEEDAPEINRLAYRLGKMTSLPALVGSAVHEVLARHFRMRKRGKFRELIPEEAVEIMRGVWIDAKKELWKTNPKKFPPLFELYYDRVPSVEDLRGYADRARSSIQEVKTCSLYKLTQQFSESDYLWVDPVGKGFTEEVFFNIPPFEAIAVPDLVIKNQGRLLIVDWKTGKAGLKDHLQIEAGAIWISQRLGKEDKEIWGVLPYLDQGVIDEFIITDSDLLRAGAAIRREMEDMSDYLADRRSNIPLSIENFPLQENKKFCEFCEFQEICFQSTGQDYFN